MLRRRRTSGSAIMETGPALYVFLLLIFFPMVDLVFMGVDFCGSWYMNHLVVRELALRKKSEWPNAISQVVTPFTNAGVGQFMHITGSSHVPVNVGQPTDGERMKVQCDSTVTCAPFLQLPIPGSIPGLSGPVTFRFSSERPRENDLD